MAPTSKTFNDKNQYEPRFGSQEGSLAGNTQVNMKIQTPIESIHSGSLPSLPMSGPKTS